MTKISSPNRPAPSRSIRTISNVVYLGTGRLGHPRSVRRRDHGARRWRRHLDAPRPDVFTPTLRPAAGRNRWTNQNIRAIEVDPKNSSRILVGTRFDLYISHDAGANWEICPLRTGYTILAASNPTSRPQPHQRHPSGLSRREHRRLRPRSATRQRRQRRQRRLPFHHATSGCPGPSRPCSPASRRAPATASTTPTAAASPAGSRSRRASARTANDPLRPGRESLDYTAEGTYVLRPDGGSTTWTKLTGSTTYPTCAGGSSATGQDWYDLFLAVDPSNDKNLYSATSTRSSRR